jgi:hypothetical protein
MVILDTSVANGSPEFYYVEASFAGGAVTARFL